MIRIDIDKVMEKVGSQLSIGDKETVRLVLGAVNECLCYKKEETVYAIYNHRRERLYQYGSGGWEYMNSVLQRAESELPNSFLFVDKAE